MGRGFLCGFSEDHPRHALPGFATFGDLSGSISIIGVWRLQSGA